MVRIKFDCWVAACLGIFVIGPINHLTLVFQILLNTWILAMWNTSVLNIYISQVSARQKRRRVKMGEDIKLKYEMRGARGGGTVSYHHSYSASRCKKYDTRSHR